MSVVVVGKQRLDKAVLLVPNLPDVRAALHNRPSVILSEAGKVLYSVQPQYRLYFSIEDIPQRVIDATIAAEDKRFREHDGVDFRAMFGILAETLRYGKPPRGGSTLTMQIAKIVYTSREQTIDRKLDDMALATMIERTMTKDQIVEMYLNKVYYGERAYGIGAAANVYFGKKDLNELTIAESALLARLVRRPSQENPFKNREVAIQNRNVVLKLMLDQGRINQEEYDAAVKEKLNLTERRPQTLSGEKAAPYFVDYVIRFLDENHPNIDLKQGGFRIETTLNSELQEFAETTISEAVEEMKGLRVTTAAMILIGSEGQILVHVGGSDYKRNQYDMLTLGARQPGSAFKPFLYSTAFEHSVITPYDKISNEPYMWEKTWGEMVQVRNADDEYGGEMSPEQALRLSINTVAARLMGMTGPANVVSVARRSFGFTSKLEPVQALALGATAVSPLEMVRAYSVFKTGGGRLEPWGIKRIIGPDGRIIAQYSAKTRRNVISTRTAKIMDTILYSTAHGGTAWRITSQQGVVNGRAKTGTTNDFRDAWLCGYTNEFVAVAWVGGEVREDGQWLYKSMRRVFGGTAVAPFWGKIVKKAQTMYGEKPSRFRRYFPEQAVEVRLDPYEQPSDVLPRLDPDVIPPLSDPPQRGRIERPDPPANTGGEVNLVYRVVCQDTGMISTIYCPERAPKPFRSGEEPTGFCPLHPPPG